MMRRRHLRTQIKTIRRRVCPTIRHERMGSLEKRTCRLRRYQRHQRGMTPPQP